MGFTPRFRKTYVLVAVAGAAAALLTAVGGVLLERRRFGSDDRDAVARIERELVQQFNRSGEALAAIASTIAEPARSDPGRRRRRGRGARDCSMRSNARPLRHDTPRRASAFTTPPASLSRGPGAFRICRPNAHRDRPRSSSRPMRSVCVSCESSPWSREARGSAATRLGSVVVEQLLGADRASPGGQRHLPDAGVHRAGLGPCRHRRRTAAIRLRLRHPVERRAGARRGRNRTGGSRPTRAPAGEARPSAGCWSCSR